MDCAELQDRIAPYLDAELAPGDAAAFEAHLERCPACADRTEATAGQALGGVVRILGAPGDAEWSRLDAAVDAAWATRAAPRGAPRPGRPALPPLLLFAAALLLSLAWGARQAARADRAEARLAQLGLQSERMDRLAAAPLAADRLDALELSSYTPHRATF